ncbi:MAG: hypothetical protein KC503_24425 [Myxococcales bacterium]|nr:hypothetical protein [Myxococcales bacterium]
MCARACSPRAERCAERETGQLRRGVKVKVRLPKPTAEAEAEAEADCRYCGDLICGSHFLIELDSALANAARSHDVTQANDAAASVLRNIAEANVTTGPLPHNQEALQVVTVRQRRVVRQSLAPARSGEILVVRDGEVVG